MTLRKSTRWAWQLLLALAMLLVQQGGLRHGVGHVLQHEEGVPAHKVCLDCLAFHAGDQAVPTSEAGPPLQPVQHAAPRQRVPRTLPATVTAAYLARAPPRIG